MSTRKTVVADSEQEGDVNVDLLRFHTGTSRSSGSLPKEGDFSMMTRSRRRNILKNEMKTIHVIVCGPRGTQTIHVPECPYVELVIFKVVLVPLFRCLETKNNSEEVNKHHRPFPRRNLPEMSFRVHGMREREVFVFHELEY